MTWRRSKANAQQLRAIRRRREQLQRAVDARIAELAQCTGGSR